MRLLIVEDDRQIAENLYDYLEMQGHRCDYAHSLASARTLLAQGGWDGVVLDRNLPDGDGVSLLGELRSAGNTLPVLLLTARDTLDDKIEAFSMGGDDYLVKPFALQEVAIRLEALHRRAMQAVVPNLRVYGPLAHDPGSGSLMLAGESVSLPPKAFRLLTFMLQRPEQLYSRSTLENLLWGEPQPSSDNLRTVLHTVRKALGDSNGVQLVTVHGQGYKLALV